MFCGGTGLKGWKRMFDVYGHERACVRIARVSHKKSLNSIYQFTKQVRNFGLGEPQIFLKATISI